MKTSKTIIAVLGGVLVGAALGVLFAPEEGAKTRKKIAKKGKETKDKAKKSLEKAANKVSDKYNEVSSTVADEYNSVMSKGEDLVKEVKENIK